MTDILDLPGWTVLGKRLEDGEYELEAEYTVQPEACQKCGVLGRLYKHGSKVVTYRDSPIRGHTVRIQARVQRYRCRECSETFLQPLAGIQPSMRMTARCVGYIEQQCLRDTFVRIAEHVGCDDKTVRDLAGGYIDQLNADYRPYLPEWLGIDETMIDGVQRCVITDVGRRAPIDMLPDREKSSVITWLHRFREHGSVKGLAIDMWRPYRDAAHVVFPGLPVVVDKFHVVRMANTALDEARIALAKDVAKPVGRDWMRRKALLRMRYKNLDEKGRYNLQMWLDNEPQFAEAYRLKEAFYDVYDASSRIEAGRMLDDWRASIPAHLKRKGKGFDPLLTATKNWRDEILAFFDYPITNGYTEALNGVAKVINRSGRGYSFEVLRARLLYRKVVHQAATDSHLVCRVGPTAERHAELLDALGRHCGSCLGLFDADELDAADIPPIVKGEKPRRIYVCADCYRRFHTKDSHGEQVTSTR